MDNILLEGCAHVYGDDINTDLIIAGKYTKTLDMGTLAAHVLEDLDPGFKDRLQPGDILVAGDNFGCGSSREQALLALKTAGIAAVAARYFARIFFRNAINVGLPVIEVGWTGIENGDRLRLDLTGGKLENLSRQAIFQATGLPPGMAAILQAGGLVKYLKEHGDYPK
jgi:3-isopropylmalate dehydratase small subunit